MRRRPDLVAVLVLLLAVGARAQEGEAPTSDAKPQGFGGLGNPHSKDPITITSDSLEYEYKDGIVTYRGDVLAVQGEIKVRSNELRITLAKTDDRKPTGSKAAAEIESPNNASKVQEVVATGNVRIDQGTKWAVGGKATFDQTARTLVLTENPVLHDGPSEVAGDRVIVYLDEDRSIVEGGRKRVKAVLFPGKQDGAKGPVAKPDEVAR
jgi:lipopolysaccharide export system protein LptA